MHKMSVPIWDLGTKTYDTFSHKHMGGKKYLVIMNHVSHLYCLLAVIQPNIFKCFFHFFPSSSDSCEIVDRKLVHLSCQTQSA